MWLPVDIFLPPMVLSGSRSTVLASMMASTSLSLRVLSVSWPQIQLLLASSNRTSSPSAQLRLARVSASSPSTRPGGTPWTSVQATGGVGPTQLPPLSITVVLLTKMSVAFTEPPSTEVAVSERMA